MTQPPDDRPRPQDPEGDVTPENEPTVAWTPPEGEAERQPEEGGVGWAAIPDPSDRGSATTPPSEPEPPPIEPVEPPPPIEPTEPAEPATPTGPVEPAEPPPPAGPIISATPSQPTGGGWVTPGSSPPPGVVPPVPAGGGWQLPPAAAAMPEQEGFVIAGVWPRFVAWLLDTLIAGILPGALTLFVIDWQPLFDAILEEVRRQQQGGIASGAAFTIPITTEYILATVIGVAFYFLYFVFFWTSRWRATPGMAILGLRVVHQVAGDTLSIGQATRRWVAMGWPLQLLSVVPVMASLAGLAQFLLQIVLLLTTATNERRQGLHDKFAGSLVLRKASSGAGATFLGCLLWIVLVVILAFVVFTVFLAAIWPQLEEIVREYQQDSV